MNRLTLLSVLAWSGLALNFGPVVEAQSGPDKRLLQKTSIQAEAKPIEELLRELSEKHKLTLELDPSFAANGHGSETFTLTADGLTLASVLNLICDSTELAYAAEKGKLLVTTKEADSKNMFVREYPLAPLGAIGDPQVFAVGLTEVASGLWKDVDGEGGEILAISPRSLSIRQSRAVHAELQTLFEQIATAGRARTPSVQERAEQTIVRKLQTPASLSAGEVPVSEVLDQLLKKNGVPYWIDLQGLADEGIDWSKATTSVEAKKMPTAARLDAILNPLELTWRVANEVVQITTRIKASEQQVVRVYDVRRLITPNRSLNAIAIQLTANEDLKPWEVNDGEGGAILELGTLLVVRQNMAIHAKLAGLLK